MDKPRTKRGRFLLAKGIKDIPIKQTIYVRQESEITHSKDQNESQNESTEIGNTECHSKHSIYNKQQIFRKDQIQSIRWQHIVTRIISDFDRVENNVEKGKTMVISIFCFSHNVFLREIRSRDCLVKS